MPVRFRDLSASEYWSLVWPFAASLVCGVLLRSAVPVQRWYHIPPDLISGLGDALVIAGILGLLLELFATRLLVEKVSNDLSERLVGKGLPPELQAHIKRIVDTDIVRDHYVKTYKFTPIESDERVQVDVTLTYEVRNYSDAITEFQPIYQDEVFYEPKFINLEYGLKGKPRLKDTTSERDPNTKVLMVKGQKKIKLQPFRRDQTAICEVTMRYRLKMAANYSDVSSFAFATIGATLRVEDLPPDFEVASGDYSNSTESNRDRSWHFDRPFVTGQHIRVWWFYKQNEGYV
jgi:hypothetical protein